MNKIFKVKFNAALNETQVVSELATKAVGTHKNNNTKKTKKRDVFKIFMCSLLSFNMTGISFSAFGEGIVVNGSNTNVTTPSNSGASVINIAKPNDKGLSHNKYSDFNVSQNGVIFNNNRQDSVTHLNGDVKGNQNLGYGQSASAILNEVNGINSSHLNGTLEVAGQKASIIISNQNGITVNGASVINASALSLTTGQLVDADNLLFDVTKGAISVEGNGINTNGLDKFDTVSKVIKVTASIMSKKEGEEAGAGNTDIKLIAGSNRYDYINDKVSALSDDDATTSGGLGIQIGGDALGSIYGNNVTLISSDSGVGVRQSGVISSPNDILITSNGTVEFAGNSSSETNAKNITVKAKDGGNINNLNAKQKVLLTNQNNKLAISNIKANDIHASSNDKLSVKGLSANNVDIYGKNLVQVEAGTTNDISAITANNVTIKSDKQTAVYGGVVGEEQVSIQTNSLNVRSAIINGAKVNIDANNNIIIDGQIRVKDVEGNFVEGGTASVSSNPDDYNKIIIKNASGEECYECTLTSTAGIIGKNVTITTDGEITNNKGVIDANDATIKAQNLTNNGVINNSEQLTITANDKSNSSVINNFYVDSGNNGAIEAHNITNNAHITSDGTLEFIFDNELLNQGNLVANQLKVSGGKNSTFINKHGQNVASQFLIDVNQWNSVDSSRIMSSMPNPDITNIISAKSMEFRDGTIFLDNGSTNYIFNTNSVTSDEQSGFYLQNATTTFNSEGNLSFAGGSHKFNNITFNVADTLTILNKAVIYFSNFFNSNSNRFVIDDAKVNYQKKSAVNGSGQIEILAKKSVDNKKGQLSGNDVSISSDSDNNQLTVNNNGEVIALNTVNINALNINNKDDGKVYGTDILINASKYIGQLINDGLMSASKHIEINTKNATNNGLMYSQGDISIDLGKDGKLVNQEQGAIYAETTLKVKAKEVLNDVGSLIYSKGDMSFNTDTLTNNAGSISTGSNLTITTNNLNNLSTFDGELQKYNAGKVSQMDDKRRKWGVFIHEFDFYWFSAEDLKVEQGEIISKGDMTINLAQKGFNEGVISSSGTLSLHGTSDQATFRNESKSETKTIEEILRSTGSIEVVARVKPQHGSFLRKKKIFTNFYVLLDDIFTYSGKKVRIAGDQFVTARDLTNILKHGSLNAFKDLPELNQIMSKVFGAEWRALSQADLKTKWFKYKENSSDEQYQVHFYGDKQTIFAGKKGVNVDIKNYEQGNNISKEAVSGKTNDTNIVIGKNTTTSLDGELADAFKTAQNSAYDGTLQDYLDGKLALVEDIIKGGKLSVKNDLPNSYDYKEITFNPVDVNVVEQNRNDIIIKFLYETRIPYNSEDYYGLAQFLEMMNISTDADEIYSIGDNYFEDALIVKQYRALKGIDAYLGDSDKNISKLLMSNAQSQNAKLGFEVGKPLSQKQIDGLTSDIVWYEWTTASNGASVLTPRVYMSNKSVAINNGFGQGPVTVSNGDINIQSNNGQIVNNNGSFIGNNVNLDAGEKGSVYTGAKAGSTDSIDAESITIKGGNVTVQGNGVVSDKIDIKATDKVNLIAGMHYDEDGHLIKAATPVLRTKTDDSKNSIKIDAKDIELVGADVDAGNGSLSLTASNDLTLKNVYEVESIAYHESSYGFLSHSITTVEQSNATSVGSGLFADKLNIKVGHDFTETGSNIFASASEIDVGNNFTSNAAANYDYYHMENDSLGMFGFTSANVGHLNGSYAGKVVSAKSKFTHDDWVMTDIGSAKAGFGIGRFKSEYTKNNKSYTNSQLNFGDATINVEKTFDFGGADINTAYNTNNSEKTKLTVNAGDIKSTKFVDVENVTYKRHTASWGYSQTMSSSYATLLLRRVTSRINGGNNSWLEDAAIAGDLTQIYFGDALASNGFVGRQSQTEHFTSETLTDNTNHIMGDITFNSKNDIVLNNVDMSSSDNIILDAKNDIQINAGKTIYNDDYSATSKQVGLYGRVSVAPLGVGAALGFAGNGSRTNEKTRSKSYSNSSLAANNITIKSGNDLSVTGGNVTADNLTVHAGGDINITSVQDTYRHESKTHSAGAVLGVAKSSKSPSITPDVNLSGGWAQSEEHFKKVNKQSGFKANTMNVTSGKDLNLTGGFIVADNGSLDVAGDVNAIKLKDKDIKNGFSDGGSIGYDGTKGIPMATFSWGKDSRHNIRKDNLATISIGKGSENVTVGGKTNGDINTNKDEMTKETLNEKHGAIASDVTVGKINLGSNSKPKPNINNKPTTEGNTHHSTPPEGNTHHSTPPESNTPNGTPPPESSTPNGTPPPESSTPNGTPPPESSTPNGTTPSENGSHNGGSTNGGGSHNTETDNADSSSTVSDTPTTIPVKKIPIIPQAKPKGIVYVDLEIKKIRSDAEKPGTYTEADFTSIYGKNGKINKKITTDSGALEAQKTEGFNYNDGRRDYEVIRYQKDGSVAYVSVNENGHKNVFLAERVEKYLLKTNQIERPKK